MRPRLALLVLPAFSAFVSSQQIWDVWQTTWNKTNLFKGLNPRPPLEFTAPGPIGSANIVVTEKSAYQEIVGFGATLTDSSALLLNNLKTKNSTSYWNLLNYLFSAQEAANAAGFSYLKLPIGATDFSSQAYTLADVPNDTCLKEFDINNTPSYVFSVAQDIISVNSAIKFHVVPWSPPAWMKDSNTINGGTLKPTMTTSYASYILRALQGLKGKGINVYSVAIQNEPRVNNPTYPSSTMDPPTEAKIALVLKGLLKGNGFPNVKILGFENNWNDALAYPVQLMQAGNAHFDGVSFHCYEGSVSQQGEFSSRYPNKEIYMTECSGVRGTDWWNDIKWYTDNIFIGALEHNAKGALMWNLALDGSGNPKYPGTRSCSAPGCRGVVTINNDGTWTVNQEYYMMAQVSKATIPRDIGGPSGKRIKVDVNGNLGWSLRVGAFETGRKNPSDWLRYSLVVLNWNDSVGGWNPTPIRTTILFRGMQVTYTFPVGLTTLWWYAPVINRLEGDEAETLPVFAEHEGAQSAFQFVDQSEAY
ncbi:glycoside hydrolase [Panaeolus papilionaceus]|nr:glycoside hydrolase [Panaeolus papilionaceus]